MFDKIKTFLMILKRHRGWSEPLIRRRESHLASHLAKNPREMSAKVSLRASLGEHPLRISEYPRIRTLSMFKKFLMK